MGILVDSRNEKRRQQQRKIDREKKLMADATAAEARKEQGISVAQTAPKTEPKSAEEKEADLNRREANRSVQYSRLPEVRAGAIKRAEAAGDTDKVRELTHAEDIEKWAKSDYVRQQAQRVYEEELARAIARGDTNPDFAATKAGDAYLDLYRNAAQETRNNTYNYRQDEKRKDMEGVDANADFAEKVNAGAKYTPSAGYEGGKYNLPSPFSKQVHTDIIMSFVNGDTDFAGQYGEDMARVAEMTEAEKNRIRYYAANGQFDKVEEYYKLLERSLNKRVQEKKNKETYEAAYENPAMGAVKNVGAGFLTPEAYVANAVNAVENVFRDEYVPTDTNTRAFGGAHMAKQTNQGVTDWAYDAAGGGSSGEFARLLAGTGLSMANFISKAPLGPTGAMIAMGADTAGQTTLDVLERGGTPGQALFLSTAAGTIEALTEKMPLDNLFKTAKEVGKTGLKATIKSVLKQAGMEATEEMVSELANTALDIAVMREKSEYQQYISELEKSGMSRAEAEKEAFFQYFGKNVLMAGAGGAISGGVMGGGASAISNINTAINRSRAGGGFTKTEYSNKITNKQIRALNAIGRALGVNISIGAPTGNDKGAYNGRYENGNIVIAQDAENPLEVVLCHEVTHHMKRTAPAEYNAFLELAVNLSESLSNTEKSELINRYKTAYSEGTMSEFSDAQALDEIAADFTSRIVKDISLFDRLAQNNRNAAVRFLDSIKDFIAKVKSTFSGDKTKADTASQEKYGASVSELETAVAQFEKMLTATETAVASGNINTAGTDAGGEAQYSIKTNAKGKYVKADRMVIFGNDPESWSEQLESYINGEIRKGQNVELIAEDGEVLTLTADTEGKVSSMYNNDGTAMSEEAFERKVNAGSHIDELAQVSVGDGKGNVPDVGSRHGAKASGGWNYRTAYFQDFDGKYYKCRLSVMVGEDGNAVYNIGNMEERSFPQVAGSSAANSGAQNREASFDNSIPQTPPNVNRQNSLKTEDLLSPDYGKSDAARMQNAEGRMQNEPSPSPSGADTQGSDTSSTASGPPSPQGEGSDGESSYIEDTGLDTYFNDKENRAQVIQDKRIADANSALMRAPNAQKKSIPEKVRESVSFVKRKMVNSGDAVRKIAKATKDGHLYAAFNRARSSMNIVSDMLRNKQTNIRGQKVGESLEGIIAPIKEKGDEYFRDFQLYLLHKHNVARMSLKDTRAEARAQAELQQFIKENPNIAAMGETELQQRSLWEDDRGKRARQYLQLRDNLNRAQNTNNKPIFFDNDDVPLNADESRRAAAELLRKNPDFARDEARVRKYLDNLMQYRVDSGLITQEEADYFKKKYPDYVPTYRDTESVQKQMQGKTNIGTTVGRAKGGNEPIIPLDVALAEMTKKVVRSGQKNIFANKVFDLYDKNSKLLEGYITDVQEGERDIDSEIDSFGEEPTFDNTVSFHVGGKNVEITVTPELFEAFDSLSKAPKEQPAVAQWWRKVNEVYKKLITTYDPTFIIRNGLKDLQDAVINSTDTKAFLKNYGRAYSEIANGGKMWELYQAAGGLYSSRFEELQNEGITEKKGKLAKYKEKLAFANMIVEQAPRLAEFMSVVEKGDINSQDTIADALLAAAEVTTNFGESGTWGKTLNAYYIPFLNPAIQGTAKVVRTFTGSKTGKEWIGLAVKCAIMGLGAGFANDLINGDDEDYENLPDRTKDNYFLFPTGDGKFLRLPKGRVVAALGVVADRVRDTMKGEKVDAGEALSRIAENILPENPLNNNIFKAWFDADLLNDESKGRTWYGTDIENDSLQSLPAGERFDNSTDYASKALGKALGVSPKKLNYILQQYTGGVGRMVLPMLTPSEQKGDSVAGKIALGTWSALTSNFTTDSKLSNKISGEFYDAVEAAEQAKNSAKGTLADKIVYKHLNRERNMVGTYNSKVRAAEVDEKLTSKEKQAAVRAASAERTEYQKTILENIDKYRSNVEKFLKKYPGKDEEKQLEYAYREANRAMYGAEYAIRVNGGSAVHKKAEEKVRRGKTTWEEYYKEYFGKTDRRYKALSDRFDISYTEFEKIEDAISKNSSKADEVAAIQKLGYKNSIARRIYTLYHDAE